MSTTAQESLDAVRTYTLEEIDDNLSTLGNIIKFSKHADHVSVMRQVDTWLDRRLEVRREYGS